jgi:hypothetical protein
VARPVILATCSLLPDGEEWTGTSHLPEAFAARGIDARWEIWDDADVDWSRALVAVRATWDYEGRREEFLAWTRSLPWVLNSAEVFAWNTDKAYLVQLAGAGVPVVPTVAVEQHADLADAVGRFGTAVVKPRVGAGGRGVVVLGAGESTDEVPGDAGPWVVQPLVESVRTTGETSVFVLGGQVVSQAQKVPAPGGEIRVHEQYGGTTVAVEVTEDAAEHALLVVATAERLLGERLDYARVDSMVLSDGTRALSELEATEPGLYLDVLPGNAAAFADLVAARLDEADTQS